MLGEGVPAVRNPAPRRYLRAMVLVAQSARGGEYFVFHLGSGSFFRTDRLGAVAARALIDGRSGAEAMELVERIEAGAGRRAWRVVANLGWRGAMSDVPPVSPGRLRLRRLAATAMGFGLSVLGPLANTLPTAVLAWLFQFLPSTPIASHVWRSTRLAIVSNLQESGFAGRPDPSRNYL